MTHFWPIWLLFFAYLLWRVPVGIWSNLMNYLSWDYTVKEIQYNVLADTISEGLGVTPIFIASVAAAMAVFSYLYTPRAANLFHALPVNRAELFLSSYLSGILSLLIPELVTFVAAVFVCVGYRITCIQYLFWWLLFMVVITFFAYSMAVFIGMITGQVFAVPIYFAVANFLYIGIRYILSMALNLICYGIDEGWRPGNSGMLSPWYFLETHLKVEAKYHATNATCTGLDFCGERYLAIYAVAAVFFILGAWLLYRKRPIETAGDLISVKWVKPVFRWGVALAGGSLMAIVVTNMLRAVKSIPVFVTVMVCVALFGFVFFFVAEMFLVKGFKVLNKKRLMEWAVFAVLSVSFFALFRLDAFGIEKRIPKAGEVQEAFLYVDIAIEYDEDDVEELISLHEKLVEKKEEYHNLPENQVNYVTIKYYLKDGSSLRRRYPVPLNEETVHDKEGVVADIVKIRQRPENILKDLFGMDYKENQYMSAYVELYDENHSLSNEVLDGDLAKELAEAVMLDVRAGDLCNIADAYDTDNAPGQYVNGISFSIFHAKSTITTTDYYYNYSFYRENQDVVSTSTEVYLCFNENCRNIIRKLEEYGIYADGEGFYTTEEFEIADVLQSVTETLVY